MSVLDIWSWAKKYANGIRILTDWLGSGGAVVPQYKAQARANVCLECHKNQPGNIVTKAAAWAIKEQTDLKNDMDLKVDGETNLHTCQACLCWLRLKIWLPIEKLRSEETPETMEKYVEKCWMRTEL